MQSITISVRFRFEIKEFPLNLTEIFIVVKRIMEEAGQLLVKELLRRLEQEAWPLLRAQGCTHKGYKQRILQGCLGRIVFHFLRVKHAGKVRYALSELVEIPSYVRHTDDAIEPALGLLPHVSYKRSSLEGARILGSSPGKTTLHRRLKEMASEVSVHPVEKASGYRYLVADGTGARFQRPHVDTQGKRRVETYQGELRAVYASKGTGKPFEVIGRWSETSWKDIAKDVYGRINGNDLRLLISDGGAGIEEAFRLSHMKHQRCSVHAWRDLRSMLYQDGVKKDAQKPFAKIMHHMPALRYDKHTMENLKPEDADAVEKAVHDSEDQLLELQNLLTQKGYHKTATYIANLSGPMLTFMREWLTTGNVGPATSNIAENRFSMTKNRIRTGRRWSEQGLMRWFDVAIHKTFPGYDWKKLWEKLLPLSGNISCQIVAVY